MNIRDRWLKHIINQINYPGHTFVIGDMGDGHYVQVRFVAPDSEIRQTADFVRGVEWSGRKWYISSHATESEVVLTCLKAVITALEHEAREKFTYLGFAIFHPHPDVKVLVERAQYKQLRKAI